MTVVNRIRLTGLPRSGRVRYCAGRSGSLAAADCHRSSEIVAGAVTELVGQ
jgi:hypothetical protein